MATGTERPRSLRMQPGGEVSGESMPTAENAGRWKSCYTCRDYAEHRRETLAPHLANKARRDGRDVIPVVDEFMDAAHQRHLDGNPLRPGGPTRITDPTLGRLAALLSPGLFGPVTSPASMTEEGQS